MRKVIIGVMACLLVGFGLAIAEEGNPSIDLRPVPAGITAPPMDATRLGDCTLGLLPPDSIAYGWDWDGGYRIYKLFVDPATDIFEGDCTPPFYPLTINSVDLLLYSFGDSVDLVGQTVCIEVDIECPANLGTTYPAHCNGPGTIICTAQVCYTYTEEDASGADFILLNVPFTTPCCVQAGFFVGARLVSWTGANIDDAPAPLSGRSPLPNAAAMTCKVWWFNAQVWGTNISPPCWQEIVTTYVTPWGPWSIYANVTTEATCEPIVCHPCDHNYPGDDESNPIIVDAGNWSRVIDLCDYCPDYDQRAIGGTFSAQGGDVVLEIAYPLEMAEACFHVLIEPLCADPQHFFRIRSWMNDSYGLLYAGTPTFPTFGQSQTYDFTAAGLGCVPGDVYHLFIDVRGCCCPVRVTFAGDTPLPVELLGFDAIAGDGRVQLNWRTASETANDHFEIMRDGVLVQSVPSQGNGATERSYTWTDADVVNGVSYEYTLAAVDLQGVREVLATRSATPQAGAPVITEYALHQNFPNPFNPVTSIAFDLVESGFVSLRVYNLMGQEVANVVSADMGAGRHIVNFDASRLGSGVYLYTIEAGSFTTTKKMLLMK